MDADTLEAPQATSLGEDLDHFFCSACYPNGEKLFCGLDGGDEDVLEYLEHASCVVCEYTVVCPDCGL